MKLDGKTYKLIITKKYFQTNKILFFVQGINQNSLNKLYTEQRLFTIGFKNYKLLNRIAIKTLSVSIYSKNKFVIKSTTFLIRPRINQIFLKHVILNTFNSLFLELLIIKFNDRLYSASSLKNMYSFTYNETKLLFYQFNTTCLKNWYTFSK